MTAGAFSTFSIGVLCPTRVLMLLIPYLQVGWFEMASTNSTGTHRIIVGLSRPIPQPCTRTSFGKPMGSSISGRNMPLFPISTHFWSKGWKAKISRDGYTTSTQSSKPGLSNEFMDTNLCVWVVRWFETEISHTHFFEKDSHKS